MKVLIIDKDISSCYYCLIIAEQMNYSVHLAVNGKMAVEMISSIEFDIIISEIHLPGVDGIEFIHEINQFNPKTKIIILTADVFFFRRNPIPFDYFKILYKPVKVETIKNCLIEANNKLRVHD